MSNKIAFEKYFQTFFTGDNVEFTVDTGGNIKVLFTFPEATYQNQQRVYSYLQDNYLYFIKNKKSIDDIFYVAKKLSLPIHISFHFSKKIYRIYIGTYYLSLDSSKKIFNKFAKYTGYIYEHSVWKIDCIGWDLGENLSIKIYELIEEDSHINLGMQFMKIKESGVLKNIHGRKKYFQRFLYPQELYLFSKSKFSKSLDDLTQNIENVYTLQMRVKYYCWEGEKIELYII